MNHKKITDEEILFILNSLEPKINKALYQTTHKHREDLSQDIKEKIIRKLKSDEFQAVPGLFEFIKKNNL